ncbi:hypothetical protein BJ875DRAFT_131216 [Amylocarpus encephaloides]|uniref:Transmembrane protein n=1 Tax=Amylocarpus encephaloides TaxID=45428 RepID=A0A9P8C8A6_9HELO|nr:hypothetical protein BJ875DRAFT_131216 [Amylocarpus encephaloides]
MGGELFSRAISPYGCSGGVCFTTRGGFTRATRRSIILLLRCSRFPFCVIFHLHAKARLFFLHFLLPLLHCLLPLLLHFLLSRPLASPRNLRRNVPFTAWHPNDDVGAPLPTPREPGVDPRAEWDHTNPLGHVETWGKKHLYNLRSTEPWAPPSFTLRPLLPLRTVQYITVRKEGRKASSARLKPKP